MTRGVDEASRLIGGVQPRSRRWRPAAHGLALAAVVVMLAAVPGCGASDSSGDSTGAASTTTSPAETTTTTPPPPPPPPVDGAELPRLLPSVDELKTIMGNPSLIAGPVLTELELPNPSEQTFEPADCMSSFNGGAPPAYDNSGYRDVYAASQAQSPSPSLMLGEGVATFDSAEAAQKALAAYVELWRRCADKRFTWTFQGQQSQWTLGQPVDAGGGVTSLRNVNDNSPVTVTRAIAAKNNVLVDVQIMGSGLTEQNITIANRILERIPG